ncbi:MAG TPA: PEP-CTERM sorting domain-containing protein [Verrucomicrobiales bacterium]|nr:PEP-CTERM sorting domain-containing protein [Verrucomicrobiales bacterium]
MSARLTAPRILRYLSSAIAAAVALPAAAVTVGYSQSFQSPADSGDAATAYPEFTSTLNGGTATVVGGVLRLTGLGPSGTQSDQLFTVSHSSAPSGELTFFGQIGASNSNGNYNVGMIIGQNRLVFHPGFTAIPGAFRVEGPGGFGNTNMGFVPANGLLHQFEIHSFPSGLFTIKVTDAGNPANVFNAQFTNLASYGAPFGFVRSGPAGAGAGDFDGRYDNLQIIPEPSAAGLFLLAGFGLVRRRR